ncbi:MAG TPA: DUF2007 domain-containing protein [Arachidicoccus sp.]|nr:DUF2007 domain-containing protein [Arachidicoccus sp.]
MAQFVTIYTSMSLPEIYVIQGHLEAAGIPSFTKDERINQMAPHISSLSCGIQLQVRSQDIEKSVELLQAGGYLKPAVSKNDHFFKKAGLIFLAALLLEIIYLLIKKGII